MKRFLYVVGGLVLLAGVAWAAEVNDLNITDASNTARFPEGMAPGDVNDGARALEGIIARWESDINGSLADGGSANTYTIASPNRTLGAYYDGLTIAFEATNANTGASTLNVSSLGAANIVKDGNQALEAGDIAAGQKVVLIYDGPSSVWQFPSSGTANALGAANNLSDVASTAAAYKTLADSVLTTRGDIMVYNDATIPARLALGSASQVLVSDGTDLVYDTVLPRGYIAGMQMSNGTDADHDIDITLGAARGASDADNMITTSTVTKRIDANWSTGSGNGGRSSSTSLSATTTYHVFAIEVGGTDDFGFDTSPTADNLISDHTATAWRVIGSVITNEQSNIVAFTQVAGEFLLSTPVSSWTNVNPGTSAVLQALSVPTGRKVRAIHSVGVEDDSPAGATFMQILVTSPDQTDTAPTSNLFTIATGGSSDYNTASQIETRTDTSSQIRYRSSKSDAGITVYGTTHGWLDDRGQND